MDISVHLGKLKLNNPVMPASGTFGYGIEYKDFMDLNKIGAIVTKGISLEPKTGNPPPRIMEGDGYLINHIGLENVGVDIFLREKLPLIAEYETRIIVNFFGNTEKEYCKVAARLDKIKRIDALEMNISCPNVKKGGLEFGVFPETVYELVKKVRENTGKFLIVKISSQISDIKGVGKAIEEADADAITAINTLKGFRIDIYFKEFFSGGISGNFLKPIGLKVVNELSKFIRIPIIGCGGIKNYKDVIEYLLAGASAVQIGTHNFIEPNIIERIIGELQGDAKFKEIINRDRRPS